MIARVLGFFVVWLAACLLVVVMVLVVAWLLQLAERVSGWLKRRRQSQHLRRWRSDWVRRTQDSALASDSWLVFMPSTHERIDVLLDVFFREIDPRQTDCRACLRMRALGARYPQLTLVQLDAIVRRQIALGHCEPHRYNDAVPD